MKSGPTVTLIEEIARTRLFRVERVGLRFAQGREVSYERVRGSARGGVLVVPMLDARTVLLVREYAAGVDRYELALPKGRIEGEESVEDAANREIMEEVGYGARSLVRLTSLTLAPGYFSHVTHTVLAQDLYPETRAGDEPEPLEVVPWSLDALDELLARTDVTEARSIAALYMVREHLRGPR